jgi:hypothetical protein
LPTASSVVFPAIDQALESIPVTPRTLRSRRLGARGGAPRP